MNYPTRDELDEEHTWDLTRIYASPDEWEAERAELADHVDRLRDLEDPTDTPAALAAALEAIETAYVTLSRLELYALLRKNEDTTDEERRDRHRRANRLAAAVDDAVQALRRRIHRDAGTARAFRDDPALDGWRTYLDDLLARADSTRGSDAEAVIAAFEPVVEDATEVVVAITTGDFEPPGVEGPDGEPFEVDRNTYREALDSPDRSFRRRAHEAFYEALGDQEHALAAAIARKIDAYAALARARNYGSVRELRLSGSSYPDTGMHVSLPESAHDAVLDRVREQAGAYHDLLESRRACLGVDRLRPWDLSAPLVDGDPPDLDFETVRTTVLDAAEPLGADYRDRLAAFLDERRVDVYPTERKRTDIPAFCPSSPETGAFVMANFLDDLRTAFFVVHELGHAMHVELMREARPPRYVNSPQPISEVPSILQELLFADHLLETGDPTWGPFVHERRAELLAGNAFGAGRSAAFLHEVYRFVEEGGDLSPDRLAETYADTAAEFRGPVEPADTGWGWRREAYARKPYHSYQYVIGAVGAVAVHRALRDGDLSPGAYREFLENTGRRDSMDSLATLGVDPTDAEPFEKLAEELNRVRTARPY